MHTKKKKVKKKKVFFLSNQLVQPHKANNFLQINEIFQIDRFKIHEASISFKFLLPLAVTQL